MYGRFSQAYWFNLIQGSEQFLAYPEDLAEDGVISFASAFWRYMTPIWPKPSVHDAIIGRFDANKFDEAEGIFEGMWDLSTYLLDEN